MEVNHRTYSIKAFLRSLGAIVISVMGGMLIGITAAVISSIFYIKRRMN